jgi:hypothetical protein
VSPLPRLRKILQLCAALLLCWAGHLAAQSFTFAAFGDAPYTEAEQAQFIDTIAAMNRAPLAFVIHVGDFKSSWSPCSDALFQQRRDEFALSHHPLIYAPGDNDWTDCWRALGAADSERDPEERLQQLRRMLFADHYSLGQHRIAVQRQSTTFPEHARWEHGGVVFATLNMPGGDNNARQPQESAARTKMVEAWIAETFRTARAQARGAVVLAMQANPWSITGNVRRNYSAIMAAIARETRRFGNETSGEVLLIHGDTHRHRIDQPLMDAQTGQPLRNFTRIEVFGSPAVNWVRVTVTRDNGNSGRVRFTGAPGH